MDERSCDIIGLRGAAIFVAIGLEDDDLGRTARCRDFALYVFSNEADAQRYNGILCNRFGLTDGQVDDIVRPAAKAVIGSGVPPTNGLFPVKATLSSDTGFDADALSLFEECADLVETGTWDEAPKARRVHYDVSEARGRTRKGSRFKQELNWVLRTFSNPNWRGKDKEGNRTLLGATWVEPHERYDEAEELVFAKDPEARRHIEAKKRRMAA
jgi:hypothetical protein